MSFDLAPFKSLIKERTGLSFEDSRSARLAEAIRTAMAEKQVATLSQYYSLVLKVEHEFLNLVNRLTVNETYFFREPAQLRVFVKRVLPEMLHKKGQEAGVRILSAGCSTGEEPYSLVIAAMERLGSGSCTGLMKVVGVDIDSDAIFRAKKGIYGKQSFRALDVDLKSRYFERVGKELYQIKDFVRAPVEFRVFNLLSDSYPEDLLEVDVIFYRNVSIYFEPEIQRRIFRKLSESLRSGGYLITSSTETLSHNLNLLTLVELDGAFLYRKGALAKSGDEPLFSRDATPCRERTGGGRSSYAGLSKTSGSAFGSSPVLPRSSVPEPLQMPPLPGIAPMIEDAWPERVSTDYLHARDPVPMAPAEEQASELTTPELYSKALALAEEKKYALSLDCLEELLARDSRFVDACTLKANVLINLDRLDDAAKSCRRAIEVEQLCLEAYLLLGIIARRRDEHEECLKRFREALYVKPSCWLAHFYLGELYHARDECDKARREYEIILSLSERGGLSEPGLSLFRLSVPVEQVMQVCRHKLALLEG